MEQIVVQVKDKEKAKLLLDLLKALDFVDSVSAISHENDENQGDDTDRAIRFLLAGRLVGRERY